MEIIGEWETREKPEFGVGSFFGWSSESLSNVGRILWYYPLGMCRWDQLLAWASWPQAVPHQQAELSPTQACGLQQSQLYGSHTGAALQ